MIVFLKPGEQVEVQFVEDGATKQSAGPNVFEQSVVIKHRASDALVGTVNPQGKFIEAFQVALARKK